MTDTLNITLKHFNTIGQGYQWFLLYEFIVDEIDLFQKSDLEILNDVRSIRILDGSLFHKEMNGIEIELKGLDQPSGRPFNMDKLVSDDFHFLKTKSDFETWISNFRTDGWEEDREDAQDLIDKAEREIWSRTNLHNGIWNLSKDKFQEGSDKLIDTAWIYIHFETFIEIDRVRQLIRTFDFGYD